MCSIPPPDGPNPFFAVLPPAVAFSTVGTKTFSNAWKSAKTGEPSIPVGYRVIVFVVVVHETLTADRVIRVPTLKRSHDRRL